MEVLIRNRLRLTLIPTRVSSMITLAHHLGWSVGSGRRVCRRSDERSKASQKGHRNATPHHGKAETRSLFMYVG